MVCCKWVHPGGCDYEARGATTEEVLVLARAHALEHGIDASPELLALVEEMIEDE